MKILVIPDVHGIGAWRYQAMAAVKDGMHVIFLGDYVDSYVIEPHHIYSNFEDIINFKIMYPDQVTLLLGNHDYAYVFGKSGMSGYDFFTADKYRNLINKNWNLFDLAWGFQGKYKYTLITHAGLTQDFYDKIVNYIKNPENVIHDVLVKEADVSWKKMALHELLNYFMDACSIMWTIGQEREGSEKTGSILWADINELIGDRFKGIDQIVGHSVTQYFKIEDLDDDKLYFTDVHTHTHLVGFMIELK